MTVKLDALIDCSVLLLLSDFVLLAGKSRLGHALCPYLFQFVDVCLRKLHQGEFSVGLVFMLVKCPVTAMVTPGTLLLPVAVDVALALGHLTNEGMAVWTWGNSNDGIRIKSDPSTSIGVRIPGTDVCGIFSLHHRGKAHSIFCSNFSKIASKTLTLVSGILSRSFCLSVEENVVKVAAAALDPNLVFLFATATRPITTAIRFVTIRLVAVGLVLIARRLTAMPFMSTRGLVSISMTSMSVRRTLVPPHFAIAFHLIVYIISDLADFFLNSSKSIIDVVGIDTAG